MQISQKGGTASQWFSWQSVGVVFMLWKKSGGWFLPSKGMLWSNLVISQFTDMSLFLMKFYNCFEFIKFYECLKISDWNFLPLLLSPTSR